MRTIILRRKGWKVGRPKGEKAQGLEAEGRKVRRQKVRRQKAEGQKAGGQKDKPPDLLKNSPGLPK